MIEVVVALALISLFLTGVVVVELTAIKNVEFAQNKSIATELARQQLERARVVRDTAGIGAVITPCASPCYINKQLTPAAGASTGKYIQSLTLASSTPLDCPKPAVGALTPTPIFYKVTSSVSWGTLTPPPVPPPDISVSSCLTDWR